MTSISKLIVGGFKSIRERTEIPIAPLTLLFGPNSAGKSSVMDAMDALRQRLKDALSLHASNVMSASEDLNRIIVNIDPQAHRIAGAMAEGEAASTVVNLGMKMTGFSAKSPEFGDSTGPSNAGRGVFLTLDGTDVEIELNAGNRRSEIISTLAVNGHTLVSHVSPMWIVSEGIFQSAAAQLNLDSDIDNAWTSCELGALVVDLSNPHWQSIEREHFLENLEKSDDFVDEIQEAKNFKKKLNELKKIVEKSKSALIHQLIKLHGNSLVIRSTSSQLFRARSWLPQRIDFAQRGNFMRVDDIARAKKEVAEYLATETLVDWIVTAFNALTHEVVHSAHEVLDRSVVSGDRSVLTEEYVTARSDDPIFSDMKQYALALGRQKVQSQLPFDLDANASQMPADFVNDVLSNDLFMGTGYQVTPAVWKIDTQSLWHPDGEINGISESVLKVQLFLRDANGRILKFDEVGSGISYVMPVLVSLWRADMSWISQPELHLHPEAQCNMGDVLIRAFNRDRFSVTETHSEHLLLRILRRIRQTSSGAAHDPELKCLPGDVSVLYFEPKGDGSTCVRPLRVTRQGDFMDRWPNGFFEERGRELFDE